MTRSLALLLSLVVVGCDSGPDEEPATLIGEWGGSGRAPTFGAVHVYVGESCYPSGCVPTFAYPEEVAYDVALTFDSDGAYRVRRQTSYFPDRGASTDTLTSFVQEYSGSFTTTGDSLLLAGEQRAPALRYHVSHDSLVLRIAFPEGPVVQIPNECGPGSAPPPECGGAFERVRP